MTDINVVGRDGGGGTAALADADGDGFTVVQSDAHGRAGHRVGHCGGVGDGAVFGNGAACTQGHPSGVGGVDDGGRGGFAVNRQLFEVAARRAGDGRSDRGSGLVDIVGRGIDFDRAHGLAGGDVDDRAVGQGHGDGGLRGVGQRRGVGDLAAFGGGGVGSQADRGGIDGVRHLGVGRLRIDSDRNAVAPGRTGDGGADLAWVDVDIVDAGHRHVDAAAQLACFDGNELAIRQSHGHSRLCRDGQGRGVNENATGFGDGRRAGEAERGRRPGIGRVVDGVALEVVVCRRADRSGRVANGRVHHASGLSQHHHAVAASCVAAVGAAGGLASGGGFEVLGRVGARSDGLLQFGNRWRGLRGGLCQVGGSAGRGSVCTPLRVTTQIQVAAVSQFERDRTFRACQDLFAGQQPVTLNEYTTNPFSGDCDYLANNAFDDGNHTAHGVTLRIYVCGLLPLSATGRRV